MVRVMRVTVPTEELVARLNLLLRRPPASPPMSMTKLRRLLTNPHFIMATAVAHDSERRIVGFAAMNLFESVAGWTAQIDEVRAAVGWANRGVSEELIRHLRLEAANFERKQHASLRWLAPDQAASAVA